MNKLRKLAALAAMLPLAAMAQLSVHEVYDPVKDVKADAPTMAQSTQLGHIDAATALKLSQTRLNTPFVTSITAPEVKMKKAAAPRSISSNADLAGTWIMTYQSLTNTQGDGGDAVTINPLGNDSITIANFWQPGAEIAVKAKVNVANSTISIPWQGMYTHTTYGIMDLAVCSTSGTPDRTQEITGTINADGTISLNSWWGVFVNAQATSNANALLAAYFNTAFDLSNSTMKVTQFDGASDSYAVKVTQTAANLLSVKNFGNKGMTVEIELNRARSGKIASQVVWDYYASGVSNPFYSTGITSWTEDGKPSTKTADGSIPLDTVPSDVKRKISWGGWTALASGYYLGANTSGSIETNFDIEFPVLAVTEFPGSGTQADPYLISSLDHLILLSDKVNGDKEYNYTYYNNTYARSYLGKYFKLTADIDMAGYRFDPIGNNFRQIFAGQFDGDGHTIKNLSVNTGSTGYAGLFGRLDTLSVVKNLILDSPTVETTGNYGGGLCAWSLGELRNIRVINPSISVGNLACGGMAGISWDVYDCNVTGGTLTGNGYVGSLLGENDHYVENSWGNGSKVVAGASANNYPSGGLIGSMPYATGTNLWFAGTVDGYSLAKTQATSPNVGGLTGAIGDGTLTNSFFVGTVMGYGTEGYVGGICGRLQGSTLENCYARGRVASYYSRHTGGISGHVMYITLDGVNRQSVVKNCYAAVSITAETYQYDVDNTNIETLGTFLDGATPTVENLYYDKQIYDMGSTKYSKALTTAELTSGSGVQGFDASVWQFTEGQYPRLKASASTEAAQWSASALLFAGSTNSLKLFSNPSKLTPMGNTMFGFYMDGYLKKEGHFTVINGNNIAPNGKGAGQDTLLVVNGNNSYYYVLDVVDVRLEGNGDPANPYEVRTAEDLIWLSKTTTEGKILFPNTYFKMTNDIDLGNSEEFLGICCNAADAANKFYGIFDGGGFTIHQMKLYRCDWTTQPSDGVLGTASTTSGKSIAYQGFVGRLGEQGVLKNINFAADCDIDFWATSGMAVGYNYGLIDNVRNYADVRAASCWVGGISGYNMKGGIIRNCYNAGKVVSSYANVGGIVGTNYSLVENCVNTGEMQCYIWTTNFKNTNQNMVGGITGSMNGGKIVNCANYGRVFAENKQAGGISGTLSTASSGSLYNNDVIGALSAGVVETNDLSTVGAIGGAATGSTLTTTGEVSAAYFDQQIVPYPPCANQTLKGCIGANTSMLTSGQAIEGLSADLWQFDAGMYPTLKQFASETKVKEARALLFTLPDGSSTAELNYKGNTSGTLTSGTGMSWSYSGADVMSVDGNTFKFPGTVEKVTTGILTGTNGSFTRKMNVQCVPAVPLDGNGSEATPYLISSTDDWNNLVTYVLNVGNNFDGKFLKINADLDFTGKTFKALFADGVSPLAGTLDGANHTVKGISFTPTASYQGPIGMVAATGTIKDLTLEGTINSTFTYTGGFTGKVYGKLINVTNNVAVTSNKSGVSGFGYLYKGASLDNVVNKANMTGTSSYVCGIASNAEEGVSFNKVGNEGNISSTINSTTSSGSIGCLAGLVGASYANVFTDCYNKGTVEAKGDNIYRVAGLVAYSNNTAAGSDSIMFVRCYNEGDVTAAWLVAGVLGEMNASTTIINSLIMKECHNAGTITAKGCTASSKSPGASGLSSHYSAGSIIEDCWNEGFITNLTNGTYLTTYCAGLLGYYKTAGTVDLPVKVKRCFNLGEISSTGNQVGGIIAYCANYVNIDSCWNIANCTGGFGVGGIVDCLGGVNSTINNCWNSGIMTSKSYQVGGIIGYSANAAVTSDCFNVGSIILDAEPGTSTSGAINNGYAAGGIAGRAGVVKRCYNLGQVTGKSRVGGLLGYTVKNSTVISDSYNAGTIVAPADTAGSIIGITLENNGSLWTATNAITNCYHTNTGVMQQGTAITRTGLAAATDILGNEWNYGDSYTFPMLLSNMPEIAKVYAAQVITQNDEALTSISKNFHVGMPEGVTWKSSTSELTQSGNKFAWSNKGFEGNFTLTATLGEFKNIWNCKANVQSGLNDADAEEVVSEMYFTTSGIRVDKPETNSGMYVVVRIYGNGSKKTTVEKF